MSFVLNAIPLNTNPTSAGSRLLTKKNFFQPSLLRTIGERTMAPRMTRAGASSTYSKSSNVEAHSDHEVKKDVDMDIFGEPISSDEEEQKRIVDSSSSPPRNKTARRPKFSPPSPMIPLSTKPVKQAVFSAVPDLDDLFSSSQPKKKRKINYTTRNIHTAKDVADVKVKSEVKFLAPAALRLEEEPSPTAGFKAPPALTEVTRRKTKNRSKEAVFKAPSPDAATTPANIGPKFKMPTALEGPDSSAPSLTDSTFDIPEASQADSRKRSGSTSSLSSHSSIEIGLSLAKQQELAYDDTGDGLDGKEWDWCDICKRRVERSLFRELCAKYNGTRIRQRQRICAAHKKRKAEGTWAENGYPMIDWQHLEANRTPRHMPHLKNVLRRNIPSFYRTELDVAAQKGRKALESYLKDGVIDVAKQGYYGPRGARVMGHAITTRMENELAAQLKTDKAVRAAGFGGYVSAVLVPELMIELVKEDMGVTTGAEARKILEQSTEDGELINGDDDEVVLRAEGDD